MAEKLKFAFYWAAACGGCDVAVLDLNEKILDVAAAADIYLWPIAMDFKYKDVEALPDKFLDVCFFNGAIRNSEQKEIARLLRRKSKTLVAFGACACFGGVPSLANFYSREELLNRVYLETPSTDNAEKALPQTTCTVGGVTLTLPEFYGTVYKLDDFVPVEYYLPGCPPPASLVETAVNAIVTGNLPSPPATVAEGKSLCESCPRKKEEKKVQGFKRLYEVIPEPEKCLLEQGIVCLGPVTRGGCGAQCINANMPCRGCFGPLPGIIDQGATAASIIAAMIEAKDEKEIKEILSGVVDPGGTFYRFGLANSLLRAKVL